MALGAVAAVALVGGTGFALAARTDYHNLEDDGCDRRACPGVDGRVDRMERKALVADLLIGTSVAAAAVATYFTVDFMIASDAAASAQPAGSARLVVHPRGFLVDGTF
jgi:hypothetical protein